MAYIVRIIKGRYTYLYEGTSRRVPGRKHPVSDRVFIGRVDNETNRFIPKSYTVSERLDVDAWEFRIRRLPRIPRCYLPLSQYPTDRKHIRTTNVGMHHCDDRKAVTRHMHSVDNH